jgi:hypothetical protein
MCTGWGNGAWTHAPPLSSHATLGWFVGLVAWVLFIYSFIEVLYIIVVLGVHCDIYKSSYNVS